MPWQEACVQEQRMRFIHDWQKQQDSMAELCRRYGISRRVGYKWLERYRQEGIEGLQDQSRAPRRHPNQTPAALEERIVALRARHGRWGPTTLKAVLERKDAAVTWPARSTIGQLLKRQGLSLPRRRRPRAAPTRPPLTPMGEPNQVWSIDFKGWFRTQDGERCDPLTISDGASRYLLRCQGLRHPDGEHVRALMEAAFREYGLPRVLRSDNGPPFATVAVHGLSSLAVWWIKLGICPERIEPGHPEQNGRHERMHRTLKQETASPPARTLRAQQRAFDRFRREYNEERPHQGLELKTPGECYGLSPRPYPSRIEEPVYPAEFALRRVVDGVIRWRRQKVFVGKGLNGERVGLEQIGERLWRVWFSFYELGWLDERQGRLSPPGPEGAGARPRRGPDSGRPAGSLRPAPSSDEKCYLCAWHKVLPMSRSAQNKVRSAPVVRTLGRKAGWSWADWGRDSSWTGFQGHRRLPRANQAVRSLLPTEDRSRGRLHHPLEDSIALLFADKGRPPGHRAAFLEHGLELVQCWAPFLVEETGIDDVAPKQGFFAGSFPVAGVVVFILQFFDARAEEGIVVVVVERHAGAEDIDDGEAFVVNGLLHELLHVFRIAAVSAGDEGGAMHDRGSDGVDRLLHTAKRRAPGLHALTTCR